MADPNTIEEYPEICEIVADGLMQTNLNLRPDVWPEPTVDLESEVEVNTVQEEICESFVDGIIIDDDNNGNYTEQCMEESIVYVFDEEVVEFDAENSPYIIQNPLEYNLEEPEVTSEIMDSSSSPDCQGNDPAVYVLEEETDVQCVNASDESVTVSQIGDICDAGYAGESIENNCELVGNNSDIGLMVSNSYASNNIIMSDSTVDELQSNFVVEYNESDEDKVNNEMYEANEIQDIYEEPSNKESMETLDLDKETVNDMIIGNVSSVENEAKDSVSLDYQLENEEQNSALVEHEILNSDIKIFDEENANMDNSIAYEDADSSHYQQQIMIEEYDLTHDSNELTPYETNETGEECNIISEYKSDQEDKNSLTDAETVSDLHGSERFEENYSTTDELYVQDNEGNGIVECITNDLNDAENSTVKETAVQNTTEIVISSEIDTDYCKKMEEKQVNEEDETGKETMEVNLESDHSNSKYFSPSLVSSEINFDKPVAVDTISLNTNDICEPDNKLLASYSDDVYKNEEQSQYTEAILQDNQEISENNEKYFQDNNDFCNIDNKVLSERKIEDEDEDEKNSQCNEEISQDNEQNLQYNEENVDINKASNIESKLLSGQITESDNAQEKTSHRNEETLQVNEESLENNEENMQDKKEICNADISLLSRQINKDDDRNSEYYKETARNNQENLQNNEIDVQDNNDVSNIDNKFCELISENVEKSECEKAKSEDGNTISQTNEDLSQKIEDISRDIEETSLNKVIREIPQQHLSIPSNLPIKESENNNCNESRRQQIGKISSDKSDSQDNINDNVKPAKKVEENLASSATVAHSLYGDDDPVANIVIETVPALNEKPKTIDKNIRELIEIKSPKVTLQQTQNLLIKTPSMLPSVLNRNKSPLKKPSIVPNLPELIPENSDNCTTASPVKSVLRKEQMKKRLQAFSLLKQGIQPVPLKKIIQQRAPKLQVHLSEGYDENGKKTDEKLVIIKKPPKQGQNPLDKAKAVIDEIEEIKRCEATMLQTYMQNQQYTPGFIGNPLAVQAVAAANASRESSSSDRSKKSKRDNKSNSAKASNKHVPRVKKYEKYGRSHKKTTERDKIDKKKTEKIKNEEIPANWSIVKKKNYSFEKISKIKEKTLKTSFDALKYENKNDKKYGQHKRFEEDDKNANHIKAQLMFEYPSLPRFPLLAVKADGTNKSYPQEIVRYTEKYPKISYCENPKYARGYFPSRKQIMSEVSSERADLMLLFIEHKYSSPKVSARETKTRKWFPCEEYLVEQKDEEISGNTPVISYGLAVLSENYLDQEENIESPTEFVEEKTKESPRTKKEKHSNKSTKKSKSRSKSKERSKSNERFKSKEEGGRKNEERQKKSGKKSEKHEDTEADYTPKTKLPEDSLDKISTDSHANVAEDKTPNTDEYRSNWESDEDILSEIMVTDSTKTTPYNKFHRQSSLDKNWESDEDRRCRYPEERKHDYITKYSDKRKRNSMERTPDEPRRKTEDFKRKHRNCYNEEKLPETENKHYMPKSIHQNFEHNRVEELKYEEERSRHLVYNKWSSEEDISKNLKSEPRNKRIHTITKPERKQTSVDRTLDITLTPKYQKRSQWSSDDECDKRQNYEENRIKVTKTDNERRRSRWEDVRNEIEPERFRNQGREEVFETEQKDFENMNIKELERKHSKYAEAILSKRSEEFLLRKSDKTKENKKQELEEKLKYKHKDKKQKRKYKDKEPKVKINYSDLEETYEEQLRIERQQKKDFDILKSAERVAAALKFTSKIKIDYSDFDVSLNESKENLLGKRAEDIALKIIIPVIDTDESLSKETKIDDKSDLLPSTNKSEIVLTLPEVTPIPAPALPIPSPQPFEKQPVATEDTTSKLASEYEEFMKAVCFDEPEKKVEIETKTSVEPVTEKASKEVSQLPETPESPEIEAEPQEEDNVNSNKSLDSRKDSSSYETTSGSDDGSDSENSSDQETDSTDSNLKDLIDPTNIKTEVLSDTENDLQIEISNRIKYDKRKRDPRSAFSSNENLDANEFNPNIVVKVEKEPIKKLKSECGVINKTDEQYKCQQNDKKYDKLIDWESSCSSNVETNKDDNSKNELAPLKYPIIDITDMTVPNILPENIPLPSDQVISNFSAINLPPNRTKDAIPNEELHSSSTKKPRSFIPIKLLTSESRKQANATSKSISVDESLNFDIFTSKEIVIQDEKPSSQGVVSSTDVSFLNADNANDASLYESLGNIELRTDLIPSRKRQSQWNLNITPTKKPLLQTVLNDSDEDFTDKFIKNSENKKLPDKDTSKKTLSTTNKPTDVSILKEVDIKKTNTDEIKETKKTTKVDDTHKKKIDELEHKTVDKQRHSSERKHDKNSDSHKSESHSHRSSSHDKRDRSRDSSEKKRDKSRDYSSKETQRDREKRKQSDRRTSDRKSSYSNSRTRSRYSRERDGRSRGRDRSRERTKRRDSDRRDRDHKDDRSSSKMSRKDDTKRYSRSPTPTKKDRRSPIENIPIPTRQFDDTDFSTTSMDIVQSPANSPLDGFKRSLADSTISDSELIGQINAPDESNEPVPDYKAPPYFNMQEHTTKAVDSPCSPKRISLDDRINLVLGLDKEPPKQIDTVCTRGPYNNRNNYDMYGYTRNEYDMYNATQHDGFMANPYPNQYQQPYYPPQMSGDNNMKVVQVGNVIQVVPTEQPISSPVVPPIPKPTNEAATKVVQVGNMLQIVPMTIIDSQPVASTLTSIASTSSAATIVSDMTVTQKTAAQLAIERRAEKEKRRQEREQRRKEKEKKKKEKEKRRQLKMKLKTETMIKQALLLETGEGDPDILNISTDTLPASAETSNILSLPWPPATIISAVPLPKPPSKGILVIRGSKKEKDITNLEQGTETKKIVKFADGICPGEGTSPSAGEELPSPPPPPRKLPKEKRYKKVKNNKNKKKVKVKIIRTQQPTVEEDEDSEDNLPPPPPPPGSPPAHLWPLHLKTPPPITMKPILPTSAYPPSHYRAPPLQKIMPPPQKIMPPPQNIMPPPQNIMPPPQNIMPPPHNIMPPQHNIMPPPHNIMPPPHNVMPPPHQAVLYPPTFPPGGQQPMPVVMGHPPPGSRPHHGHHPPGIGMYYGNVIPVLQPGGPQTNAPPPPPPMHPAPPFHRV